MRCRCALLAGLIAASAPRAAAADPPAEPPPPPPSDVRDAFGLGQRAGHPVNPATANTAANAAAGVDCSTGLAFDCAVASDPLDDATPYALSTWLSGAYLRRLPTADRTHDAVASYALGASSDGAGPTFGGASGAENRWTIDGAPADNIQTGLADTRVPLSFLDGILVTAGGFSARDRTSTGGTIDARLKRGTADHEVTVDVWASLTGDAEHVPIAAGAFAVRRLTVENGPHTTASLVATGPITHTTWYAIGIQPTLANTDHTWRASHVNDANGDGLPDGFPGDIQTTLIETTAAQTHDYFVPAMARLGYDSDSGTQHLELSVIGQAERTTRFASNATLQAAGIDQRELVGDAIATWRGTWGDTRAKLQLAWHRNDYRESAHDAAAADIPQLQTAYIPATLADDPKLAAACVDASNATIAHCPVPFGFFSSGGAGLLTNITGDRPSISAELAHAFGHNVIRLGFDGEDSRLITTTTYTGHALQFSLFPGEQSVRQFDTGDCSNTPGGPCDITTNAQETYHTLYGAAYLEDTFSPQPGVQVDGGLRWELMWVGSRLHFSQELAPRVGVSWDVLGDGRSRIWTSMGRSYAMLPAGLGTTLIGRPATVDNFNLAGTLSRVQQTGAPFPIPEGVEPVEQDEVTAGAEFALAGALRATLWGQGRFIRRALETTPDGFTNPGLGNPGLGDPSEAPAIRETEMAAFQLELAATDKLAIRAGITWGRTVGTWSGPYDPRQGLTLLQGSDWDAGSANLSGRLPTDTGARMFMELERHGRLGSLGLAAAGRLSLGSGTPRSVIGDGDGVVDLLPQGSAGRNPLISRVDLRVSASWHGFTLTLDVFNVFDHRDPTSVDSTYTDDAVQPIDGGSLSDLVFLKTEAGQPARRRTSFDLPTTFQDPISASLGVHKAF